MRAKGWRLDPAWIEHYSKLDRERIEREIQRIKMEVHQRELWADNEAAIRRLKAPVIKVMA